MANITSSTSINVKTDLVQVKLPLKANSSVQLTLKLTVYEGTSGSFAVFSPQKAYCQNWVCLNLRKCVTNRLHRDSNGAEYGIQIIPREGEGHSVEFYTQTSKSRDEWMQVLTRGFHSASELGFSSQSDVTKHAGHSKAQSRLMRQPTMPILEEEVE